MKSALLQIAAEQTAQCSYNNLMNINAIKIKNMLFKFCEKPVVVPFTNLGGVNHKLGTSQIHNEGKTNTTSRFEILSTICSQLDQLRKYDASP